MPTLHADSLSQLHLLNIVLVDVKLYDTVF